jgi:hypothetical protein
VPAASAVLAGDGIERRGPARLVPSATLLDLVARLAQGSEYPLDRRAALGDHAILASGR